MARHRVAAVVALKPFAEAKSRLGPLPPPLRRRIAACLAYDTIGALASALARVVVVSDQPSLAALLRPLGPAVVVLAEGRSRGINAALAAGAEHAAAAGAEVVMGCVGDLPCLQGETVLRVLAGSAGLRRAFVADASGIGTTMLISRSGDLEPRFSGGSAAAHTASGATPLDAARVGDIPDARRDVDTEADLLDAYRLGVGPATSSLFVSASGRLGNYDEVSVTADRRENGWTIITSGGFRAWLPIGALERPLREVRSGQRLHAVLAGQQVLSAWL